MSSLFGNAHSEVKGERETRQRSLGCIGVSVFAHAAVLLFLLSNAQLTTSSAEGGGNSLSEELVGNLDDVGAATPTLAPENGVREVILADAEDVSAIALPSQAQQPAKPRRNQPELKAQPKPIEEVATTPLMTSDAGEIEVETKNEPTREPEPATVSEPESLSPLIAEATDSTDSTEAEETAETLEATEQVDTPETPDLTERSDVASEAPEVMARPTPVIDSTSRIAATKPAGSASQQGPAAEPTATPAAATGAGTGRGAGIGASEGASRGTGQGLVVMDASLRRPLTGNPLPSYPQQDRYSRRQGTTVLIGRVGLNGQITSVQVENSSGSVLMDRASYEAFKKWRFAPGPEALVRKTFRFALAGEEKVMPARLGSR